MPMTRQPPVPRRETGFAGSLRHDRPLPLLDTLLWHPPVETFNIEWPDDADPGWSDQEWRDICEGMECEGDLDDF